jgi:hypothetical protein
MENLIGSEIRALIIGVPMVVSLAFVGLLVGVGYAQFLPPPSPAVFLIPLGLNIGLGWMLVRKGQRTVGQILLYGGSIVSVALPFVLL